MFEEDDETLARLPVAELGGARVFRGQERLAAVALGQPALPVEHRQWHSGDRLPLERTDQQGLMWRDIGLGEWLFDMDNEEEIPRVVPAVLAMAKDPAAAKAKALKARERVQKLQQAWMETLGKMLSPS